METSHITKALTEIEEQHSIKVLYACESGSRAWGFPSSDSDYDVRFIYMHPKDWYFSIDEGNDFINLPINDELDINGWDLKKALRLLRTSNAGLQEWLQSPIVYTEQHNFLDQIDPHLHDYFSSRAGVHHYLSMAQNAFDALQEQGPEPGLKKYFYCLRATLAAQWIVERNSLPPMELPSLRLLIKARPLQYLADELLQEKSIASEKTTTHVRPELHQFIETTLAYCKERSQEIPKKHTEIEPLNNLFRKLINEY